MTTPQGVPGTKGSRAPGGAPFVPVVARMGIGGIIGAGDRLRGRVPGGASRTRLAPEPDTEDLMVHTERKARGRTVAYGRAPMTLARANGTTAP
jgi:hypothetical protein